MKAEVPTAGPSPTAPGGGRDLPGGAVGVAHLWVPRKGRPPLWGGEGVVQNAQAQGGQGGKGPGSPEHRGWGHREFGAQGRPRGSGGAEHGVRGVLGTAHQAGDSGAQQGSAGRFSFPSTTKKEKLYFYPCSCGNSPPGAASGRTPTPCLSPHSNGGTWHS